jgi:ribosomal protein L37AE/L43A
LQLVVEPEPDRYFCSRDKHHRVSRGDKTCPRCGSPVRKTATEPW